MFAPLKPHLTSSDYLTMTPRSGRRFRGMLKEHLSCSENPAAANGGFYLLLWANWMRRYFKPSVSACLTREP